MLKKEEIEIIKRYIDGAANEDEATWVESLFSEGEDNISLYHYLENDWKMMVDDKTLSEIKFEHLLDKVHHKIWKTDRAKQRRPLQRFMRIYMKAAAILLLPLIIAGGLVYTMFLEKPDNISANQVVNYSLFAPMGSRISFTLPDGTHGMLNSGSTLSYSLPFTNNRNLKLDGEGWFDVAHDENHPFSINTMNSRIKVLGTVFNVRSYPDDKYVEVVLQNGKVEFEDNINKEIVTIRPSERLVFQDGSISTSVTDPSKYRAWTEGMLVFRDEPMDEVARRIERWYNVKVILADASLEKYSFHATFTDDKLEDVLYCLSMTSPITYKIRKQTLMPDGSYNKALVTIYMKK